MRLGWSHWVDIVNGINSGWVLFLVDFLKLRFVDFRIQTKTRTTASRLPGRDFCCCVSLSKKTSTSIIMFGVEHLGFEVNLKRREVDGSAFAFGTSDFEVNGSGFGVHGSIFEVDRSGFEVDGSGLEVEGSGLELDLKWIEVHLEWTEVDLQWISSG